MGSLSFMFCPTSAYNQGLLKLSLADIRNPVSDSVLQKINVKCVVFFHINGILGRDESPSSESFCE